MQRLFTLTVLSFLVSAALAQGTGKRSYMSGGAEISFTNPVLDVNGSDQGGVVRFAPVVNVQQTLNSDMSDKFGLFLGLSVNNVGFIYDAPQTDYRFKFRSYNLGLPVGIKIGTMNGGLLFAGYSIEWAFNYKQKEFLNEEKQDKFSVWASDRTEPFMQAWMAGFQLGNGTCLKVKYYFTNFHNQEFTETKDIGGVTVTGFKPYDGLNANIIYASLGFALFKDQANAYK
jgi:hypothetical protein